MQIYTASYVATYIATVLSTASVYEVYYCMHAQLVDSADFKAEKANIIFFSMAFTCTILWNNVISLFYGYVMVYCNLHT